MLGTEPRWSHDDKAELRQLSDWVIEADGVRLAVAPPDGELHGNEARVSLGVSALELADARRLIGHRAQLFSRTQGRIAALTVKSVDPELSLLIASFEPDA